ncbi:MAG: hypothetical protein QXV82_09165 [Ignisphaera sp.]
MIIVEYKPVHIEIDIHNVYDCLHLSPNVEDIVMMRVEGRDVVYFRHVKLNLYFGVMEDGAGRLIILSNVKGNYSNIVHTIKRLIRQYYTISLTLKILRKLGLNPKISMRSHRFIEAEGVRIEVYIEKIRVTCINEELLCKIAEALNQHGLKLQELK